MPKMKYSAQGLVGAQINHDVPGIEFSHNVNIQNPLFYQSTICI